MRFSVCSRRILFLDRSRLTYNLWRNLLKQFAVFALALAASAPVFARPNVGVSISINQPGVYGRVDIGDYPAPPVVYTQPVLIAPAPVVVYQDPIYLYVPVVYQRNWGRYCGRYGACGQPVYFVQEQWVRERYLREREGQRGDRGSRHHDDDDRGDHGHRDHGGHGHHDDNDD